MSFLADDEIDRRAIELRTKLGIHHQMNPDVIRCVYKAKELGLIKEYLRSPFLDEEASFDPDTRVLSLRESVFGSASRGERRARFTIAHELGHIALGHSRKRFRGPLAHHKNEMASSVRSDEIQADIFAGAFLMPYDLADVSLTTTSEDLAERFNVSIGAADARRPQLLRTFRIRNGIKRPLPDSVVQFLNSTKPSR